MVMGLGFGAIMAPSMNTATSGVAPQDAGIASALVNTMQQVGGSIGTAVLSTIAASAAASYATGHAAGPALAAAASTHGYTMAFTTAAILFAVGAVVAFSLLPARHAHLARQEAIARSVAAAASADAPGHESEVDVAPQVAHA